MLRGVRSLHVLPISNYCQRKKNKPTNIAVTVLVVVLCLAYAPVSLPSAKITFLLYVFGACYHRTTLSKFNFCAFEVRTTQVYLLGANSSLFVFVSRVNVFHFAHAFSSF